MDSPRPGGSPARCARWDVTGWDKWLLNPVMVLGPGFMFPGVGRGTGKCMIPRASASLPLTWESPPGDDLGEATAEARGGGRHQKGERLRHGGTEGPAPGLAGEAARYSRK